MSSKDLMEEAFRYINAFKRSRALEQVEKERGNHDKASFQKLKQYEYIDKLELAMRAIQKDIRQETK